MPTEEIEKLTFNRFIMTIGNLPSSYVESLSYYECMLWLCDYLQNTVIPAVNNNGEVVEELQDLYIELKNYVDNYFDNLDVQEEINNKLDEMASDGTLTNLIKNYVDPIYEAYETQINGEITDFKNTVNGQISSLTSQVQSTVSGSPKGVYATLSALESADPDHDYIYVVTADGKWYYYDISTTSWTVGGIYQSSGIGVHSIDTGLLSENIQENICDYNNGVVDYTATDNKKCSVNTGAGTYSIDDVSAGANYRMYTISVLPGEAYYVKSNIGATNYQIVYVNSTDSSLVGYDTLISETNNTPIETNVVIPAGANVMYVNSRTGRATRIQKLEIAPVNDYIKKVDDINNLITDETVENITNSMTLTTGYFYNLASDAIASYATGQYYEVTCQPGDVFYITTRITGNMCTYCLKDENGLTLETGEGVAASTTFENLKVIVKNVNAAKLLVDCMSSFTSTFKCEKVTSVELNSVTPYYFNQYKNNNDFEVENVQRRCKNLEDSNPFEWKPFDKAYFAFVIDDCNSFTPTCADLFHTLNKPLGCAVITSTLNTVYDTAGGRTIKEVLDDVVEDGGEVLAHYSGNLAPAGTPDEPGITYLTTYNDWKTRTRDVKQVLESKGFTVRGLIRADSTIPNTETGQYWCQLYFDYSDKMGTTKQYNLYRKFFINVNTLADMKDWIDTCCQTPGFYPMCLHGNREDEPLATIENLTAIINYIDGKGSAAAISTYSEVFDTFKSTSLEQRIADLEQ